MRETSASDRKSIVGDKLMAQITRNEGDPGVLSNRLLGEFRSGYPLSNLVKLITDESDRIVEIGSWIASELGDYARPIMGHVPLLLKHPNPKVRFFAIDTVLSCGEGEKEATVQVVRLSGDPDAAVRWKVLVFLSSASEEILRGALSQLEQQAGDERHLEGLRLLVSAPASVLKDVCTFLEDQDAVLKGYGAAAAVRVARIEKKPLITATRSDDLTVRRFAVDMMERIS